MFEKIKRFGRNFTQTTPFILSNTVIFIPYLLFLSLSDGNNLGSILPFTLFYTFRMTGGFLIRSIRVGLDSYTLLMISLLIGGTGTLLGIFGALYFPLFYFSSVLLGLSAAWLPPANVTVNYHEKRQGFTNMTGKKYPLALLLLVILFRSIELSGMTQVVITFGLYTLFYIMAYHTVSHYPRYELDFKDIKSTMFVPKEFVLFLVSFGLLFVLRNARLLLDSVLFDSAIYVFLCLFILVTFYLGRAKKSWKLPAWLNLYTFLSGMVGNFLFLFSTLYVGVVYGFAHLAIGMYLPYIAGMILAKVIGIKLLRSLSMTPLVAQLVSLFCSLLILLIPGMFTIGLFLVSFCHTVISSSLNRTYYETKADIPMDQRVIIKYTTQNKGSVVHQFLLMGLLLDLTHRLNQPVVMLLQLTDKLNVSDSSVRLMEYAKWGNIGFLLVGVVTVYLLWKWEERHAYND
ncbi:MAG: hypothetical protein IC227_01385 [Enterococcus lacertideformus]|uniref:Uncharacterized protein n=1 Tax=Enterococcus lacertideformus TaxID=2771493 RepID=A0A931AT09_9ENTE|nr:hypothetical protein [Enterococcus lacertideformus]